MRCRISSLIVGCLMIASFISVSAQSVSEQYLFALANQDRSAHGLSPLQMDHRLAVATRMHAYEMFGMPESPTAFQVSLILQSALKRQEQNFLWSRRT